MPVGAGGDRGADRGVGLGQQAHRQQQVRAVQQADRVDAGVPQPVVCPVVAGQGRRHVTGLRGDEAQVVLDLRGRGRHAEPVVQRLRRAQVGLGEAEVAAEAVQDPAVRQRPGLPHLVAGPAERPQRTPVQLHRLLVEARAGAGSGPAASWPASGAAPAGRPWRGRSPAAPRWGGRGRRGSGRDSSGPRPRTASAGAAGRRRSTRAGAGRRPPRRAGRGRPGPASAAPPPARRGRRRAGRHATPLRPVPWPCRDRPSQSVAAAAPVHRRWRTPPMCITGGR